MFFHFTMGEWLNVGNLHIWYIHRPIPYIEVADGKSHTFDTSAPRHLQHWRYQDWYSIYRQLPLFLSIGAKRAPPLRWTSILYKLSTIFSFFYFFWRKYLSRDMYFAILNLYRLLPIHGLCISLVFSSPLNNL